jgi:5-hydroxyisourate hydrolase-like protein (transthyretin family)
MKRMLILTGVILAIAAGVCVAGPRDALWNQVDNAIKSGLPKTAIGLLEQIIPGALQDQAYAEATKAICLKIVQEGSIQGGKAEELIVRLQDEMANAPEPMKPVMETVLAHWYWLYFQQNRWRFVQRTQTAEPPGEDITTWDLARILAEIDKHFTLALCSTPAPGGDPSKPTAEGGCATLLKATPISLWDDLLEKGTVPDTYRPTLYDFLAYDALEFYSSGEQAGALPQDTFEIMADSGIFAPAAEFLAWQPQTSDTQSARLKAIRLYQSLLAFHQNDKDKTAFIDADLQRLIFGYNQAVGPDKDALYAAALEGFVSQWESHELAALALYRWAGVVYGQGDYLRARALAQQAWDNYPASAGGILCYNLIQQIEGKSASITTERVWNEPLPDIAVAYRNITRVFFRAVPVGYETLIQRNSMYVDDQQFNTLLATRPVLEWSAELPPTSDYQQRTEKLPAPRGLAAGTYYILASHDSSFKVANNQISVAAVWVSDLALVVRSISLDGAVEGFVLDARSGRPIRGATVTRWKYSNSDWQYHSADQTHCDGNGLFRFVAEGDQYVSFLIVAESGGQRLASQSTYYTYKGYSPPGPSQQTVFFTDRSLYRPGQTLHYKGICIQVDTAGDQYQTLAGKQLTVVFNDANGQEIARQQVLSNDYGSFSGSFTAPRDRLMGQMSLSIADGPGGSASFHVEEYKRPKFYTQFDPPAEAPRLNTEVVVPGNATAYTGASIGGAKVGWSVVRQVRFPPWCWWGYRAASSSQAQAIAHGEAVTASDGSFEVRFIAKPDLSVAEEDEPVFEFQVHADVTDTTGETRSADRTVRAGCTALQATLSAGDWQTPDKPVELAVTTQTLDGQGEPAEGTLRVYALKQPDKVIRATLQSYSYANQVAPDASNPETWELAELVSEQTFKTDAQGRVTMPVSLGTGIYRAMLTTQDRFGKPVTAQCTVQVVDPQATHLAVRVANHLAAPSWSVEPGESFTALWGTGYDTGQAYVELECRGKVLHAWWTDPNRTQEVITQTVTEDMRGGFTLRVTYVRENRAYLNEQIVAVPWTNKQLTIAWEHFRSLLEPGQKDTWTAVITGPDARKAVAEMVAAMYDASLDQYLPHDWIHSFSGFRSETSRLSSHFENSTLTFDSVHSDWGVSYKSVTLTYRHFPDEIMPRLYYGSPVMRRDGGGTADVAPAPGDTSSGEKGANDQTTPTTAESGVDLSQVSARTNLDETAFFFPHLVSDSDGVVRMEFTMPEALTQWRFLGFAHDRQMRSGFLTDTTVTAKDLMVEPNPPRFVREGDVIEFTVKVTNRSAARQTGKVALTLSDARTLESRDEALGNTSPEQAFDVPSQESRTCSWRLTVPDGCEMLIYKAVGATTRLSDGEQGYLPVLSRRILVTESLPLPIRGPQTKDFEFTKLLNSGQSGTLIHQSLTVQMVSQPAWYAVMALPYLMEYPYESSDQIFTRLYANSLAAYIANSDPKTRRVFDQWKATPALDSPLEKNEDLKGIALEETPWVVDAIDESQARRNVGILFDQNRLSDETARALYELGQRQNADGLWPWFPGCRGNEYITLYIVTGFGRLRHLGLNQLDVSCAVKALTALDKWMDDCYRDILSHGDKDSNHLSSTIALYLYGRSFFLANQPIAAEYQEARDYWLGQGRQFWLSLPRQSQAHLAIGLQRFGDKQTPAAIMKSIKEFSVTSEEMGMYWRDTELSWWWYHAPIETQAMMIEAFDEVMGDTQAVEDCRVWLLKQKQTRDWKTTRATADAVYALLLRGADLLSSDAIVQVALAGQWIQPQQIEAGTGFYEERFVRKEITPDMGRITVKKTDSGVSWGAVHWQYLEDMSKVTPYAGTPLQLHKSLYIKKTTDQGQVLFPVAQPPSAGEPEGSPPGAAVPHVGDELVVRIELRVDRDMEYVHMEDQRGSGTEPVEVLSQYRYQDGLAYYESTRDTASHFFMDYLPKGTYIFEYSTRIQLKGKYQTGIATIQCLYAPEFNSHSESFNLEVN